jgi:hypothetical protein
MASSHTPDIRELFFKVREIAMTDWAERDGVVYYDVVVTASGGRRWTQERRYQDFQELEMQTWKRRGPMPPFPMPWTPGQISRRVDPFGRVGRLEAKRIMLEAWLRSLIDKGRMAAFSNLRSYCVAFLDVEKHCFEPSTPLELVNNDVTALVVANAQVDVQTILLKLSMEVENMKGEKGKTSWDKAKAGPMPKPPEGGGEEGMRKGATGAHEAAILLDVDVANPPKALTFDLRQERPTVWLRLRNAHEHVVAFKVMATKATRYFVQPAQTVLDGGGGGYRDIAIFIPDTTISGDVFEDGRDKFMFMSHPIGNDDESQALVGSAASSKTLAEFWRKASAQSTTRFKLAARFAGRLEWRAKMSMIEGGINGSSSSSSSSSSSDQLLTKDQGNRIDGTESFLTAKEAADCTAAAGRGASGSTVPQAQGSGMTSMGSSSGGDAGGGGGVASSDIGLATQLLVEGVSPDSPTSPGEALGEKASHDARRSPDNVDLLSTSGQLSAKPPNPPDVDRGNEASTSGAETNGRPRDAPPGWVWPLANKEESVPTLKETMTANGTLNEANEQLPLRRSANTVSQRLRPKGRPPRKQPTKAAPANNNLEVNWVEFRRELASGLSP